MEAQKQWLDDFALQDAGAIPEQPHAIDWTGQHAGAGDEAPVDVGRLVNTSKYVDHWYPGVVVGVLLEAVEHFSSHDLLAGPGRQPVIHEGR